jgi:hypothetical protein
VPALQDLAREPVHIALAADIYPRKQLCGIEDPLFSQPDEVADIACYQLGNQLLLFAELLGDLHLERLLEKNI